MRKEFIGTLLDVAKSDDRVVLITCDVGFGVLDSFRDSFPRRFFNLGIAEGSAISAALGLFKEGKIPFLYTIAPFWYNALEKIRLDLCYHNAHVVIVGSGSGFSYDVMGVTHWPIEDVAIYRSLPEMKIVAPADAYETRWAVRMAHQSDGPTYLRLGRFDERPVHFANLDLPLGKGIVVYRQNHTSPAAVTIFSAGTGVNFSIDVAKNLADIGVTVISMPTLKPLDKEIVLNRMAESKGIFVIEDHSVIGGLGDAVGRIVAENGHYLKPKAAPYFKGFGLPDVYPHFGGSVNFMREAGGFTVERISEEIYRIINSSG